MYNLMRCREYGHTVSHLPYSLHAILHSVFCRYGQRAVGVKVVALANLLPKDDAVDELDSYMYQTVGHQLLEAYAECAELPLFRRRIQGSSKHTVPPSTCFPVVHATWRRRVRNATLSRSCCQGLEYAETAGDEVEDLMALLAYAKQQMPEIEAVSSGAIASDYQRLRVEYVSTTSFTDHNLAIVSQAIANMWSSGSSLEPQTFAQIPTARVCTGVQPVGSRLFGLSLAAATG